ATARCSPKSLPDIADQVAMAPPDAAPRLQNACSREMIDLPERSWTRVPATFCPTSAVASQMPKPNSSAASARPPEIWPMSTMSTAMTNVPPTAANSGPRRDTSRAGSADDTSDPSGMAATMNPNWKSVSPHSLTSVGYHGNSDANSAPLDANISEVPKNPLPIRSV